MCVHSDYGTLDYQPGFSIEFCTPITVLLTGVTHDMLHELIYWSKQFDSCHTYCKSSIKPPRGGLFISNPFEGEGVGAFLEAGGLIEAMINQIIRAKNGLIRNNFFSTLPFINW